MMSLLTAYLWLFPALVVLGIGYLTLVFMGALSILIIVKIAIDFVLKANYFPGPGKYFFAGLVILTIAILGSNLKYGSVSSSARSLSLYIGGAGFIYFAQTCSSSVQRQFRRAVVSLMSLSVITAVATQVFQLRLTANTVLNIDAFGQVNTWTLGIQETVLGGFAERPSAFFRYPTTFAEAALLTVFLLPRRGMREWLFVFVVGTLTLTRTASVIGLAGLLLLLVSRQSVNRVLRVGVQAIVAIVLVYLISSALFFTQNSGSSETGVLARSANSNASRSLTYSATLDYWKDNNSLHPWGGLSGQVDNPRLAPEPLGSHSTFLALLFQFGLVGIAGFALLSARGLSGMSKAPDGPFLLGALIAQLIVEDLLLEPINYMIFSVALGLWITRSTSARVHQ